jgi:ubiquinone/menaquinone biosynthesis C-methylase UbiE
MPTVGDRVERYYGRGEILGSIRRALTAMGKDSGPMSPADLAPVDEFHIRGREATAELASRVGLAPGMRVLDVGCGLGGSVRYLAAEHRCRAIGIDLTLEYIEAARALAELLGLKDEVEFRQGNALDLPFEDAAFDVVWTEHAQMNIPDKRAFYAELARVLVPQGRLAFHDVFQGSGGAPVFPVPWAEGSSLSFLATPNQVRTILAEVGLRVLDWEDMTRQSLEWFVEARAKRERFGPPPLGLDLLMGSTAKTKIDDLIHNLREGRVAVVQAVAEKAH